jgi:hypothetical protein
MDLERGERLVVTRQLLSPIPFLAGTLALVLGASLPAPWHAVAAATVAVVGLALTVWRSRDLAVTDRRIVEYRVLLAALARRVPRLRRAEARRRRSVLLDDVAEARRSGGALIVRLRDGSSVQLDCVDEELAGALLLLVDAHLRRAPRLRPTRRLAPPEVHVHAEARGDGRCPYCHDAVPEDEAAPCPRCQAVHHAECLQIHGGCAAFGCAAAPRRGRVRG